jgi:hypothetical protein
MYEKENAPLVEKNTTSFMPMVEAAAIAASLKHVEIYDELKLDLQFMKDAFQIIEQDYEAIVDTLRDIRNKDDHNSAELQVELETSLSETSFEKFKIT